MKMIVCGWRLLHIIKHFKTRYTVEVLQPGGGYVKEFSSFATATNYYREHKHSGRSVSLNDRWKSGSSSSSEVVTACGLTYCGPIEKMIDETLNV